RGGRDEIHRARISHIYLRLPTCVLSRGEGELDHWVYGTARQPIARTTGCPDRVSGGMVNTSHGKPIAFLRWH
ncbi:hypothetical protein COCMIDRAFT_104441, partial [Bipolaris oryzae ATCC 44560]